MTKKELRTEAIINELAVMTDWSPKDHSYAIERMAKINILVKELEILICNYELR